MKPRMPFSCFLAILTIAGCEDHADVQSEQPPNYETYTASQLVERSMKQSKTFASEMEKVTSKESAQATAKRLKALSLDFYRIQSSLGDKLKIISSEEAESLHKMRQNWNANEGKAVDRRVQEQWTKIKSNGWDTPELRDALKSFATSPQKFE